MKTNKEMFDVAKATNDTNLKTELRDKFLSWCQLNGRTPLNTQSMIDWFKLEYTNGTKNKEMMNNDII